jgi:hypothetical protein
VRERPPVNQRLALSSQDDQGKSRWRSYKFKKAIILELTNSRKYKVKRNQISYEGSSRRVCFLVFLLGGAEGLAAVELFTFGSLRGVEAVESSESSINVNFLFF